MGKRVSAVAVLLATSFLGSLLALVLVGRNPLVGPSSDLARTESLREGFDGSPVTVPGGPSSSTSTTSAGAEAVEDAVLSATEAGPLESAYRPGPVSSAEGTAKAPSVAAESTEPVEDDDVLAKTSSESSEDQGTGNGNAKGHEKSNGSHDDEPDDDDVTLGSTGGPHGGPKGPKEPKGSRGGDEGTTGAGAGEKSKGSGKGPKVEKHKGSGEGSSEPHGKGKSKP